MATKEKLTLTAADFCFDLIVSGDGANTRIDRRESFWCP
jgi:hypothetical protein